MTAQEMIKDVNSLPAAAHQQVAGFIDTLKVKYLKNTQDESQKPTFKHGIGIKAGFGMFKVNFGMFKVNKALTSEDVDDAIAHAMQDKFGHLTKK